MGVITLRTVIDQGISYQVNRLYSSGIGVQYACTSKGPGRKRDNAADLGRDAG